MSITITVEDGSVVTGANSYVSLSNFKVYCDNRGYDYSDADDEVIKAAMIRAYFYLNDLPWKGVKTGRDNPGAWPRYGTETGGSIWNQLEYPASTWVGVLDANGFYIPTDEVPAEVVNAQCEATWATLLGKDLEPSLDRGGAIKSEVYDVVKFEYFSGASPTTEFRAVSNRLRGLLKGSISVETTRA